MWISITCSCQHTPPLFQPLAKEKHKCKESKRVMTDLATWLEAWNRFLCCHLSYFPITALEMAKYQTLLVMLFAQYPPQHCLEYDRLFRQTTAQDPSLRWDTIKEDIYVWTITKKGQSFRDKPSIMSRLGPPASDASNRAHTKPTNLEPTPGVARRYASGTILATVPSGINASLHMPAGSQAAMRRTQAEGAPSSDPQRGHTPLRHSQFGRELVNHRDKAWVSWLLQAICNGVSLGYTGPRGPSTAPNLISARQHPHIVTAELQKECAVGRILGPFLTPPLPNLKCSGVGVVPKKNGKWRMIHHLSALRGRSINDYIPRDEYYSITQQLMMPLALCLH